MVFGFIGLGWPEMLLVGLIGLLLFGNRLPSAMRSLGQGITEFKKGMTGAEQEMDDEKRLKESSKSDASDESRHSHQTPAS